MEKYARQAVSEGVKSADDLHVSGDSEIYRVLNLHYNRNNHIEVCRNQVRLSIIKLENKTFSALIQMLKIFPKHNIILILFYFLMALYNSNIGKRKICFC